MSFVHLHVHSTYSDGTSHPLLIAERASAIGYGAIALTDHNTLAGHAAFITAARYYGMRPVLGVELRAHLRDLHGHTLVLTSNEGEYDRLRWLLNRHRKIQITDLKGMGCVTTSCLGGLPAQQLVRGDYFEARDTLAEMRDVLGDRLFVELQPTFGTVGPWLAAIARDLSIPLVVTNDVHHTDPVTCYAGLHLVSDAQMRSSSVLPDWADAMSCAVDVASVCAWA